MADFQHRLATLRSTIDQGGQVLTPEDCIQQALADCQQAQGAHWDPKLVDTLALLICGLQQGLDLPVNSPKISAGLWLIDSHCSEDLLA